MNVTMEFEDLEKVYDLLAEAIDRVGPDNEAIFLSKVCLVLSHKIGVLDLVEESIKAGEQGVVQAR